MTLMKNTSGSLDIVLTSRIKKDIKRLKKRGKDMAKLTEMIEMLASRATLPARAFDHALSGDWRGHRECHIEPDWLLIYQIFEDHLILSASASGTHADLYGL